MNLNLAIRRPNKLNSTILPEGIGGKPTDAGAQTCPSSPISKQKDFMIETPVFDQVSCSNLIKIECQENQFTLKSPVTKKQSSKTPPRFRISPQLSISSHAASNLKPTKPESLCSSTSHKWIKQPSHPEITLDTISLNSKIKQVNGPILSPETSVIYRIRKNKAAAVKELMAS